MKNITGRVICAGKLKDNNGDEFFGLMIECDLKDRAVPFYQDVEIVTAIADPAPGHPEFPVVRLAVDPSASDPLKVAMDDPVENDRTRRELPWGDLPEPPPLPEGKTRWVNRGEFPDVSAGSGDSVGTRIVYYLEDGWNYSPDFSGKTPHIEAI